MIVADILLNALVFKSTSRAAREERDVSGGGEPVLSVDPRLWLVGGRCETQSWTSRETCGLEIKFRVFFEEGLVVIIMLGLFEYGEDGK